MNYAIHRISLDVTDDSPSQLTIAAKQGDSAKVLIVSLLDDKKNYQITRGSVAVFIAKKANGVWLEHPCMIDYTNNKVIYTFQESTVKSSGTMVCEIHISFTSTITKEDGTTELITEDLTTASFVIAVHDTILSGLTDETEEAMLLPDLITRGTSLFTTLEQVTIPHAEEATQNANTYIEEVKALVDNGDFNGVSATHLWDGTVLTVTSASGTSSADLKGEKGDSPVKGVDYWTEVDKAEVKDGLNNAVLGDIENSLDEIIAIQNALMAGNVGNIVYELTDTDKNDIATIVLSELPTYDGAVEVEDGGESV